MRAELSLTKYGELLECRKNIYESLHPETKVGQVLTAGMNRAIGNNVSGKMPAALRSFAQDTAGKLGVSLRTVERTVQMMNGLAEDTRKIFCHFSNYKLSQSEDGADGRSQHELLSFRYAIHGFSYPALFIVRLTSLILDISSIYK